MHTRTRLATIAPGAAALVLLACSVHAGPPTTGGAGSGSKTRAHFREVRDFECGTNGQPTDNSPCGMDYSVANGVFSSGTGYGGSMGARDRLIGDPAPCGGPAPGAWGGTVLEDMTRTKTATRYDELWMRARVKWGSTLIGQTAGVGQKVIMVPRNAKADESNQGSIFMNVEENGAIYIDIENGDPDGGRHYIAPAGSVTWGRWHTFELYVRFDTVPTSAGGLARSCGWLDGKFLACVDDEDTLVLPDDFVFHYKLHSYWNGTCEAPIDNITMDYDDIVIQTVAPSARDAGGRPYIGS
jgi:hypothetical protein